MKEYTTDELGKIIWEKYLEQKDPPDGVPRDPVKHYGKDWKGWIYFLMGVIRKIESKA